MANITYRITLIDEGLDSGPNYEVFTSVNCVDYTFLQNINLEDVEDFADVSVDESVNCIRLFNNNVVCNNFRTIVVGTAPTTTTTTSAPTTTTTTSISGELEIDWLLVGGGGSGGQFFTFDGGGGGAGRFVTSSIVLPINTTINVIVGNGGIAGTGTNGQGADGEQSSVQILGTLYTAPGGGGGGFGNPQANRNGRPGGSGGGGGQTASANSTSFGGANIVGSPLPGFGFSGENLTGVSSRGGHGGGAGGINQLKFWDGDGQPYAFGGSGNTTDVGIGAGSGAGRAPLGGVGNNGRSGIFKLKYAGTPVAIGGIITQSDGFTFHTFTTNGTFTFTGSPPPTTTTTTAAPTTTTTFSCPPDQILSRTFLYNWTNNSPGTCYPTQNSCQSIQPLSGRLVYKDILGVVRDIPISGPFGGYSGTFCSSISDGFNPFIYGFTNTITPTGNVCEQICIATTTTTTISEEPF
jgi:hypothetical protein